MLALHLLLGLLSVACAVIPLCIMAAALWWLDRHEREPIWVLGLTFLWGAFGATLISLLLNTSASLALEAAFGAELAGRWTPVVVAPLVEEPAKALFLPLVWMSRHFDNTVDGFVYGAATGLGFAMTENLLYFWQVASLASYDPMQGLQAWAQTVGMRTCYSAVLHASASAMLGAGLGFARFRGPLVRLTAIPAAIAIAMVMHGTFNGLVTLGGEGIGPEWTWTLNLVLMPLEALAVFLLFQLALLSERRAIARELSREARLGTLPEAHVPYIVSSLRRSGRGWCPPQVDRRAYVRASIHLGLRLRQATMRPDEGFHEEDVQRLRRELKSLLAATG